MAVHFRHLKRFSCVFNGNVSLANSGDTSYDIALSAVFSEIRIAAREIVVSGSIVRSCFSWR